MSKTMISRAEEAGIDLNALREELVSELKKELSAPSRRAEKPTKEDEMREKWLNEYVLVQLFKDGKDYRDDVCVSVNGENCLVRRGFPVKIKRKFALALEAGRRQDVAAEEYAESRRDEFSVMEKRFCL